MNRGMIVMITLILSSVPGSAGVILNTLSGTGNQEPGWNGGVEGSFAASGGNSDRMTLSGGGRMVWQGENDVWRIQGQAERAESHSEEIARSVVGHLRQNHRLTGPMHSVAFVQIQHNPFQRLESRWLIGAGGRWDIYDDERGRLSLGATHMIEVERIDGMTGRETEQRLSAFLFVGRQLTEDAKLSGVCFFQPLWSAFEDRRAMANLDLDVSLTGSLSLLVGGSVEYDSDPPADVDTTDWKTTTGLGVRF